jgi:hypothetical protein
MVWSDLIGALYAIAKYGGSNMETLGTLVTVYKIGPFALNVTGGKPTPTLSKQVGVAQTIFDISYNACILSGPLIVLRTRAVGQRFLPAVIIFPRTTPRVPVLPEMGTMPPNLSIITIKYLLAFMSRNPHWRDWSVIFLRESAQFCLLVRTGRVAITICRYLSWIPSGAVQSKS